MTSTENPTRATRFVATLGETLPAMTQTEWATSLTDCPTCITVDDPADCPTCHGDRWI